MPIVIQIDYDKKSLREAQRILRGIPGALPRVMRRANKAAVNSAGADLSRRVREKINLSQAETNKAIKRTWSAHGGSLSAVLRRPRVIKFKGTKETFTGRGRNKKGSGVTYRYRIGDKTTNLPHGFIATMKSGHRGVFLRARHHSRILDAGRMMEGKDKEAIFEVKGPSIWTIITGTAGLLQKTADRVATKMEKFVDAQIGVEFKNWEKRGRK